MGHQVEHSLDEAPVKQGRFEEAGNEEAVHISMKSGSINYHKFTQAELKEARDERSKRLQANH
jgi:hypothetical protein